MLPPDMAGGLHLSDPDERRCVLQMLGALCPVQRISEVSLWVGLVWEHRHLLPLAHGDSGHCPSEASIHIGRQRRRSSGNILVAELRAVNFIDALVAILTLQNPLIVVSQSAACHAPRVLRLQCHDLCGDRVHQCADAAKRAETARSACLWTANINPPMLCCSLGKHRIGGFFIGRLC